ncbi:hypothetical protein E6O75_ATG07664 [Venturia nashicola]|uniref:Uncharacterized protein n=1 Tax=Venturia nashicola TaxID=86259 RepID=A0A4Z1PCE6_9PEZI|nr:hypothetical protein E6O75_ATG07664 [Venturia nashicola]
MTDPITIRLLNRDNYSQGGTGWDGHSWDGMGSHGIGWEVMDRIGRELMAWDGKSWHGMGHGMGWVMAWDGSWHGMGHGMGWELMG